MATRSKRLPESLEEMNREKEGEEKSLLELMKDLESLKKELASLKSKEEDLLDRGPSSAGRVLDIRPDDYIKVISLCPYKLNLSTKPKGEGRIFGFNKFGEVKRIRYSDLVEILEVHDKFLEDGFFAIMDEEVVTKHGLEEAYGKVLTKENIEAIMESNQSDAATLFKNANDRQKELIVLMFVNKIVEGEEVNLNFLDRISRIVGYSIHERALQTKEQKESAMKNSPAN
jgi:hypothetical protein